MDGGELDGEWVIDPAHSRIGFSARHAMVTTVRGAFNEVEGRLHVDPSDPRRTTVRIRLAAASVDTRHGPRDTHLRSADFFDVERYPDIVFTSSMVDEVERRMFMVVGDLTIRGITHEVAIPIELRGIELGADGELRAGFEGSRRVDRRRWGLEWQVPLDTGGVLVSERVTMEFEISAVKVEAGRTAGGAEQDSGGRRERADAAQVTAASSVTPAPVAGPAARPTPTDRPDPTPSAVTRRARHRAESPGWFARRRGRG